MLQYDIPGDVTGFLLNDGWSCALPVTLLMTRVQRMQMDFRTLGCNQFAFAFQGRAFEPRVAHRSDVLVPPILLIASKDPARAGRCRMQAARHSQYQVRR